MIDTHQPCPRRRQKIGAGNPIPARSVLNPEQIQDGDAQHLRNGTQLDVCDKAFPAFNPLDGVFVDVKPRQLKPVCQSALRDLRQNLLPDSRDVPARDIVRLSVFVLEHTKLTFCACQQ